MDYYRVDDGHFISLITWLPKVVVFEIVEFTYAKCVDCKYYLLKKFSCNKCKVTRCQYHALLHTSMYYCCTCYDKNVNLIITDQFNGILIKCIIPGCMNQAWLGYKHSIYYCKYHCKNKNGIIEYNFCGVLQCYFFTNMMIKSSKESICIKHQKPNVKYIYNYIKKVKS